MNTKRRFFSLITLILVLSVMFSMTVLPAFADEGKDTNTGSTENDTPGSDTTDDDNNGNTENGGSDTNTGNSDNGGSDSDKDEDKADEDKDDEDKDDEDKDDEDKDDEGKDDEGKNNKEDSAFKKWWDKSNQVIGYIVAGILFVAGCFGVFFWIRSALKSDKKKRRK